MPCIEPASDLRRDEGRSTCCTRGAGPSILREGNMKPILTCVIASAFALASFAAQDKPADAKQDKVVKQETKTTTVHETAKTSNGAVVGKVEAYEPGKSIKVTVPGKIASTKSFDLDNKEATVNVAPNVK